MTFLWNRRPPGPIRCPVFHLRRCNQCVCVCVFVDLVVIQYCSCSQRSKDKDRTQINAEESNPISLSGPLRSTPDPDTNRSVNLSFPADSQVVVTVQPFDGHHSNVH